MVAWLIATPRCQVGDSGAEAQAVVKMVMERGPIVARLETLGYGLRPVFIGLNRPRL